MLSALKKALNIPAQSVLGAPATLPPWPSPYCPLTPQLLWGKAGRYQGHEPIPRTQSCLSHSLSTRSLSARLRVLIHKVGDGNDRFHPVVRALGYSRTKQRFAVPGCGLCDKCWKLVSWFLTFCALPAPAEGTARPSLSSSRIVIASHTVCNGHL